MDTNEMGGAVKASSAFGRPVPSVREGSTPVKPPFMNFRPDEVAKEHCAGEAKVGGRCRGWPAKGTPYCAGHLRQQGII